MITRNSRIYRGFSLGLALWFVFLSASIHAVHEHSAASCDETGSTHHLRNPQGVTSPIHSKYQPDLKEKDDPAQQVNGLCPICLFLAKTMAGGPSMPPEPTAKDGESGLTISPARVAATSLDLLTSVPRAPPA